MTETMWPEIRRKIFHLAGMIYVVGLVMTPRSKFVAVMAVLCVAEWAVEKWRRTYPSFNEKIIAMFGEMLRPSETNHLSGIFWMMLGVLSTAILIPPTSVAAAALLYLILGDAVASLVGMRLKGPHWPGSDKRVSGSAACFVMCLVVGQVLLRPVYGWSGVIVGALTATAVELVGGAVGINDNFSIPVASSVALMACYGLRPIFFG